LAASVIFSLVAADATITLEAFKVVLIVFMIV
jgi:hypothetical protein